MCTKTESISLAQRLHLFDKKYRNKNFNIMKYYNLK